MVTQCLLTLGAIPAISVGIPHYPKEKQRRGWGGVRVGAAHARMSTHRQHLKSVPCQCVMWTQAAANSDGEGRKG